MVFQEVLTMCPGCHRSGFFNIFRDMIFLLDFKMILVYIICSMVGIAQIG